MNQSVPFTDALNSFVLAVQLNVNLRGDQYSSLVVSGLLGATLEAELNVGESADPTGTWCLPAQYFTAQTQSVTVSVCLGAEALAGETYFLTFSLRNPSQARASPDVSMQASAADSLTLADGTFLPAVQIPSIVVDKSNATLLGVAYGSAPLQVVDVFFSGKNISQLTPLSSTENTITVDISTSFTVLSSFDAQITVTGLLGASFVGMTTTCDTVGFQVSYVSWNVTIGELVVELCDGSDVVANEVSSYSLAVINRVDDQDVTPVLISMTSRQFPDFVAIEMRRPGLTQQGVERFTDPPLVVVAVLLEKSIRQSRPFAGDSNTITMTLQSNVDRSEEEISVCCFNNSIASHGSIEYASFPEGTTPCDGATWNTELFQANGRP
ncbi:hypothetical protein T484DRAFT_1865307 [Baffinella frigidus]|nr:hypothetical protein T484DRAFT_1865307 [Cryptophyta sp. CCMP2293]